VDELPRAIGSRVAGLFKVDMKSRPPDPGDFDFYEKVVSFPVWTSAVGLITITGLIKASRYVLPVPGGVLYWASTLHVAAMVIIGIALLDHLRYNFSHWPDVVAMVTTRMGSGHNGLRVFFAGFGLLWALASLLVAFLFVANAFVAKTAAKEGLPAQLALLVGGALIGIFAVLLARQCVGMLRRGLAAG
jgi:cytochrome b subunit of formate dehydrogenase